MFRKLELTYRNAKSEVNMMSPKIGRPKSKNPKSIDIKVRIDEETNGKLIKFAEKNNITRTEVIRKGIDLVLNKKK